MAHSSSNSGKLLIGFDSAWTPGNRGAIVAVLLRKDRRIETFGEPQVVNFTEAKAQIEKWRAESLPRQTIIFLDQPHIVKNLQGQRPVENICASPVSRARGGMQPANLGRADMFGERAPIWPFLASFQGPSRPGEVLSECRVLETYPVLMIISMGWCLTDPERACGRLPKYNPTRRSTFELEDWEYLCNEVAKELKEFEVVSLSAYAKVLGRTNPRKAERDKLDAMICLLAAIHSQVGRGLIVVGDFESGYIAVPYGEALEKDLRERCIKTKRKPENWITRIQPEGQGSPVGRM